MTKRKIRSDKSIARRKNRGGFKQSIIRDYGKNGAKLEKSKYDKIRKKSYPKNEVRLFCKECVKFPECQGKNWDNCEFRKELFKIKE